MTDRFYDDLGCDYDVMTAPAKRRTADFRFFKEFFNRFPSGSALDIGCGTGHHLRLLLELDLSVNGIDPTEKFLQIAEDNLKDFSGRYVLKQGSMADAADLVTDPVGTAFCLGNTVPHILSAHELRKSLGAVYEVLLDSGVFVLQLVNYSRILKAKERILNVKRNADKLFIRFYDFDDNGIIFNILVVDESDENMSHNLYSTPLFPWQNDEILAVLKDVGFNAVTVYGGLDFSQFNEDSSGNLVIIAEK